MNPTRSRRDASAGSVASISVSEFSTYSRIATAVKLAVFSPPSSSSSDRDDTAEAIQSEGRVIGPYSTVRFAIRYVCTAARHAVPGARIT